MAFYNNEDEDQLDPNAPAAPQPSGQSAIISGQGSTPGAGASKAPDNPGNFVGIKQYLDANKTQASKLGDQVSGQIAGSIQGASDEIGGIRDKFNQVADSGTIKNLNTAADDAKGIVGQAATGAFGKGPTQDQQNRFKEVSTAQYKGPKALNETDFYQPAYSKVKEAQNYANLSKNESGNQQLLRDMYQDPSYSSGANRFDAYLLKNDEAQQKLASSRANAEGLQGAFDTADTNAAQYAKDLQAKTDAVRQGARTGLEDTRVKRSDEVDAGLKDIQSDWSSEYDQYVNLLNNSDQGNNLALNDEQMQKLGVNADQHIYNMLDGSNASNYLDLEAFDANKVIGKDEQAQLAALDQLASQYGGTQTNKYTQGELAGTLNKADAFDASKFGTSAKEQQQLFETAASTAQVTSKKDAHGNIFKTISFDLPVPVIKQKKVGGKKVKVKLPYPAIEMRRVEITSDVGDAYGAVDVSGTIANYLAGNAPEVKYAGTKNMDVNFAWNPISQGEYLAGPSGDQTIRDLQRQSLAAAEADRFAQIQKYLQETGYNKKIKKG